MTRLSTEVASNEQENDGRADGGSSSKPVTPMTTPSPREPAEIMGTFRNALIDSYPDRHIDHPERQLEAGVNEVPIVITTASSSVLTTASASSAVSRFSSVILALPASPVRTANSSNVPCISKSQMKEFREAFRLFDKDGDGSITKEELGRVMRSFGQFAREEELNTMLEEIDIDGDGNVSFEEFVEIVSNIGGANTMAWTDKDQEEQELKDAFKVFDKHNRGYITASDLRAVLQCLGEDLSEEEIEDMIKEVDVDGDGRIDFYEFVHALGESGNDDDEEEEELEDPQSPNL